MSSSASCARSSPTPLKAAISSRPSGAAAMCCASRTRSKSAFLPNPEFTESPSGSRLPTGPAANGGVFVWGQVDRPRLVNAGLGRTTDASRTLRRVSINGSGALLFNDLVGAGEKGRRDFETERFRRLEINDKQEFGGLLNRKVGRFGVFQNSIDIVSPKSSQGRKVGPVRNQSVRLHKAAD